jgi:hypothetical protein
MSPKIGIPSIVTRAVAVGARDNPRKVVSRTTLHDNVTIGDIIKDS